MKVVKITPVGRSFDLVCEIEVRHGFLGLKKKTEQVKYRGRSTVFHNVVTGQRPGTLAEMKLSSALWLWIEEGIYEP